MTTPSSAARARYAREAVTTASPAALLLMLYDRLVRDLVQAEQSLGDGDLARASSELVHAQEIVAELHSSLDPSGWDGAAGLAALYLFVRSELVAANLRKDGAQVAAVRELVEPLRDAWRQAALQSTQRPA
jgi:flagellar protein FliS